MKTTMSVMTQKDNHKYTHTPGDPVYLDALGNIMEQDSRHHDDYHDNLEQV